MATPIVAFGAEADGFVTTVNIPSQNVGSGADRVAIVALSATNAVSEPGGGLIGGVDTLIPISAVFADANLWKSRLYAAVLTVENSQTITCNWDTDGNLKLVVGLVLSGVDTTTIIEDLTTGNFAISTLQPEWTIDSATGDTVVGLLFLDNQSTFSASAPATALTGTGLGGSVRTHGLYEPGAASVTINGTVATGPNVWRGFGFNVPAAGGGGGGGLSKPPRRRVFLPNLMNH